MSLSNLIRLSLNFLKKAQELNTNDFGKDADILLKELEGNFLKPTSEDKKDVLIYIKRAIVGLKQKDVGLFCKWMIELDRFCRKFLHESFSDEFYDFISDQETLDYIYKLRNKELKDLNSFDVEFLQIVGRELLEFSIRENIFKK